MAPFLLSLALTLAAPGPAGTGAPSPAQVVVPDPAADPAPGRAQRSGATPVADLPGFAVPASAADWPALLERDKKVQFTARTPSEARSLLGASGISAHRRAAALMALGCSTAEGERGRLESVARTGRGVERVAAILALGEMNAGATALLLDLVGAEDGIVREAALLALLRDGRNAGRRRVEEIAADAANPAWKVARDLLVQTFDPAASQPTAAGTALLRLRWEAAREFGLVEGQAWRVLALSQLADDPEVLAEIVLGGVPGLRRAGVADHVLQLVLHGTGTARLRAAVAVLPGELAQLVENDLWRPADVTEWRAILDEIHARRFERLALDLVRAAIEIPECRWRAVELAGLAGDDSGSLLLEVDPSTLEPAARLELTVALGAVPDSAWLARFASLRDDPDPNVRAAFLVAGLRHDQRKAMAEAEERAADPEHPDHTATIWALARVARDPRAGHLLEARLVHSEGRERLAIATALCLSGRGVGRVTVREALSADPPPRGQAAIELVRALMRSGSVDDLEVYRALFPRPDDRALDIELARSLAELGDDSVEPLLRAAIWSGEFDISMLAVGLLFDHGGPFAILRELQNPPVSASSSDLRRVGFGIGQWGGPAEYERLLRELRTTSANPAVQGAWLGAIASRTR
jgi:hypothetical protein